MKRTFIFIAVSLLALGSLSACDKQNPDIQDDPEENVGDKPFEPIVLTKAEMEISQAANQFGFDVYHKIYKDKDIFMSPLSISLALSMTASGASGQTAEQMLSVLGFEGQSTADLGSYYQKMVAALLEADPKTTFEVANSIWANNDAIHVLDSFKDDVVKYYSSEIHSADFSLQSTVDRVNKWVSDKTHGKIPTILDGPDPDLVMALINALYFKGKWAFEFDEGTKKENFSKLSGGKTKVDMMTVKEQLRYSVQDGFRMVSLPYGNGSFTMDVILPPEDESFDKAVARFDAKLYSRLIHSSYGTANVNLKLPKFTFSYDADLTRTLIDLGMEQAFNEHADFSAMAKEPLCISKVLHKTFVDVNEKGTEAAAVTFVGMFTTALPNPPAPQNVDFFVDRPFMFVIKESSTGAVLFIGQKVG